MRYLLRLATPLFLLATPATAQDLCATYVGQKVEIISPAAALLRYRNLPIKSQFETSAAYRARIEASVSSGTLIVRKYSQTGLYLEYNADDAKVRVDHGLFGDPRPDAWSMLAKADHFDDLKPSVADNVAAVLEERDTAVGAYTGQNAFGATTRVRHIKRVSTGIFDRAGTLLPITSSSNPNLLGEIPMSATEARTLMPQLRTAFVVRPKPPYLIEGSRIAELPSFDRPRQVDEKFSLLIGDIDCGLVVKPDSTVLASYKARGANH